MCSRLLRLAAIALLLGLPSAVRPESAHACACMSPGSPREEVEKHDAVLLGRVVSVQQVGTGHLQDLVFEMEVHRWWKGDLYETVFLIGGRVTGDCRWYEPSNEYRSRQEYVGKTYIVYAGTIGSRGFDSDLPHDTLIPDGCGLTEEVTDLQDPHGLGPGQAPEPGTVALGPGEALPPIVGRTGGGMAAPLCEVDAPATALVAVVAVALAALGFAATRRRARPT